MHSSGTCQASLVTPLSFKVRCLFTPETPDSRIPRIPIGERGLSMSRIIFIFLVSLTFVCNVHAAGALAIDDNQGDQYGFSHGYQTTSDAANRALSECGGNCRIVQTFTSGCAAYAADQRSGNSAYGWATGSSGGQVQSAASQYCRGQGGTQCTVRAWACD
jgi:hypothetical protein